MSFLKAPCMSLALRGEVQVVEGDVGFLGKDSVKNHSPWRGAGPAAVWAEKGRGVGREETSCPERRQGVSKGGWEGDTSQEEEASQGRREIVWLHEGRC